MFCVQEKMKGKNKLAPRLLGVTKDSVLRLDERTKEILKVWPLTTVRRWAASPNTFTLDFGDYSDQYYSVQTTEGEQISQLIAGYIDIILKKVQRQCHHFRRRNPLKRNVAVVFKPFDGIRFESVSHFQKLTCSHCYLNASRRRHLEMGRKCAENGLIVFHFEKQSSIAIVSRISARRET